MRYLLFFFMIAIVLSCTSNPDQSGAEKYDVIIVGGGTSGTTAAIQSGRMGASTLLLEATPWLGGMVSTAGVSAIDGNHDLPSGLWGEFRDSLIGRYGSQEALTTGWVSNTLFEPHVAAEVWHNIAANTSNLMVLKSTPWHSVKRKGDQYLVTTAQDSFLAPIIIDATELGDVSAMLGVASDIGMQDGEEEPLGPKVSNDIIQDLTYVAILKEYEGEAPIVAKPANYDPEQFRCACDPTKSVADLIDCDQMLNYGKLPNNKYMINWPNCGNDIYLNVLNMDPTERAQAYEAAKNMTMQFVYFIQSELGYKNLGLADDEYSTEDLLPYIPYHRESRRIDGIVRLLSEHLATPYDYTLYRTGIAVGDYPIDHHHKKNLDAPDIEFINIKIPSYNIPMGTLLPKSHPGLIVAEKSISVSNIVNGTTRLQPVVMCIGQAAGALAAMAAGSGTKPNEVAVRTLQEELLDDKVFIMPFMDVKKDDPYWEAIQKIGATGILKGEGIPYKWANKTLFYPDSLSSNDDLEKGLNTFYGKNIELPPGNTSMKDIETILNTFAKEYKVADFSDLSDDSALTRKEVSRLLDKHLNPFELEVNYKGEIIR